jgi:enediyne biosynthesis protein E4
VAYPRPLLCGSRPFDSREPTRLAIRSLDSLTRRIYRHGWLEWRQAGSLARVATRSGAQAIAPGVLQWWRMALLVVSAGALVGGGSAWWKARSYHAALATARAEMAVGRFAVAARQLTDLLELEPGSDEAAYLLGRCEQGRSRPQLAVRAWSRITPGSEFSHQAILARMRLEHDGGRLSAAELVIIDAASNPRANGPHVRFLLVPIYSQLGRTSEAERLIEDWWERLATTGEQASDRAIDLVRMHVELTFRENPIDAVRAYLEGAARMAPDDDRVWLGRANLAIRTGAYDEARRWLDACEAKRSGDAAVWDAALRLGVATGQIDRVRQAAEHQSAHATSAAECHRLRAWLAGQNGDVKSECQELERLLAISSFDTRALERLTELMNRLGEALQVAALERRKREVERLKRRYEALFDRKQPIRDAVEMAQIAQQLGRTFEARAFLTLALAEDPDRDDLRRELDRMRPRLARDARTGSTLADVIFRNRVDDRAEKSPAASLARPPH